MKFLNRLDYKYRCFKEEVGAFVEFNFLRAARQTGRSVLLQVWEALWGWVWYGLLPKSYFNYRMYADKRPLSKKVKAYVSDRTYFGKLGIVNITNKILLNNKWLFHGYLEKHGVPLPKCWGFFHNNGGIWAETSEPFTFDELPSIFKRMQGQKIIIKPNGGSSGAKIVVADVLWENGSCSLLISGNKVPLEEFAANFKKRDYIIEERLEQHSALNAIYAGAVNTVRINTLYDRHQVRLWGTIIKIGTGTAEIDNWGKGSLCVGIDMETGRMRTGSYDINYSKSILEPLEVHPDTGTTFAGVQLPYWQELKDTVSLAATMIPSLPYIAWDVAITPDGPCIIEGNGRSDLSMVQVGGGLNSPEIREWWKQYNIKIS